MTVAEGFSLHREWAGVSTEVDQDRESKTNENLMHELNEDIRDIFEHEDAHLFPVNRKIYELALQSEVSPLALLTDALAYASAMVGPFYQLPPIGAAGADASLSLYVTIVGHPGGGKSTVKRTLSRFFDFDPLPLCSDGAMIIDDEASAETPPQKDARAEEMVFRHPPTSPGLSRLFLHTYSKPNPAGKGKDISITEQLRAGVLLYYDEPQVLIKSKSTQYLSLIHI